MMETALRASLDVLVSRYSEITQMSAATIGKRALNDNTFFNRLAKGEMGFNVRTYDRLLTWFHRNWPRGVSWPDEVRRPTDEEVAA